MNDKHPIAAGFMFGLGLWGAAILYSVVLLAVAAVLWNGIIANDASEPQPSGTQSCSRSDLPTSLQSTNTRTWRHGWTVGDLRCDDGRWVRR